MSKNSYGSRVRVIAGPEKGLLAVSLGYRYVEQSDGWYETFIEIVHPPTRRFFFVRSEDIVIATDCPKMLPYHIQNKWPIGEILWED